MTKSVGNRVALGLLLGCALLMLNFGSAFLNLRKLQAANQSLIHTYELVSALTGLLSAMQDVETGQRGYIITGNASYLDPYHNGLARIQPEVRRLEELTAADVAQHQRLLVAIGAIDKDLVAIAESVRLRDSQGFSAAQQLLQSGKSKLQMDAFRAELAAMIGTQEVSLVSRYRRSNHSYHTGLLNTSVLAVLGLGALGFAWYRLHREITARLQTAADLNLQKEWYRTTLASIGDAVIATDNKGHIIFINPVAESLTGWTAAQAQHVPVAEVLCRINEMTHEPVDSLVAKVLTSGAVEALSNDTLLISRDGIEHPIEVSAAPIGNSDADVRGVVIVFRDIADKRQAGLRLQQSEDRYRTLITALSQIVWTTDAAGRVAQDSPSWRAFTGQSFAQFRDGGWLDAVHPGDRATAAEAWEHAISNLTPHEVEYRLRTSNGDYRHTLVRAVQVFEGDGRVREWVGMNMDITERKEADQALRESEERFRQVAAMTCEWIWEQAPSGRYIYTNEAVQTMLGYAPEEVVSKHYSAFLAEKQHPQTQAVFPQGGKITRRFFRLINHYRHKDGHEVVTESTGEPIFAAEGKLSKWRGVDYDITERTKRESTQRLLAAIVEYSNDAIVGKTLDGIITSWNGAAEHLFGYTAEEAIGRSIKMLIPPARLDEEEHIIGLIKAGKPTEHFETVRMRKDGSFVDVSLTVSPIRDAFDQIVGASKTARDISDRKQAERERQGLLEREQQAREQAELATRAKDEFLAMVSHELRTPLNAMLGWVHILQSSDTLENAMVFKAIDAIGRNIDLQRQLIDDLLDNARILSGKLRLEVQALDLVPVVEAALEIVRPAADARAIKLCAELPAKMDAVTGDATRLQQVVWNLLSNAIKFTPKGGTVYVALQRHGSYSRITVRDTGKGIDTDLLPYIFDRYSQAAGSDGNRRQAGLGLGLALVRQLVELHGGQVGVESAGEGYGACFTVDLPVRTITAQQSTSGRSLTLLNSETASVQGIRVLIVDDQGTARELLTDVLEGQGALVTSAASGSEALQHLGTVQPQQRPDILICDIDMPEMNGYALIRNIRALEAVNRASASARGSLCAIALTAHARPEDRVQALRAGFQMHIAKPVEPTELIVVIDTLLGKTKAT
jgi:PAS domain S-box-containing protein